LPCRASSVASATVGIRSVEVDARGAAGGLAGGAAHAARRGACGGRRKLRTRSFEELHLVEVRRAGRATVPEFELDENVGGGGHGEFTGVPAPSSVGGHRRDGDAKPGVVAGLTDEPVLGAQHHTRVRLTDADEGPGARAAPDPRRHAVGPSRGHRDGVAGEDPPTAKAFGFTEVASAAVRTIGLRGDGRGAAVEQGPVRGARLPIFGKHHLRTALTRRANAWHRRRAHRRVAASGHTDLPRRARPSTSTAMGIGRPQVALAPVGCHPIAVREASRAHQTAGPHRTGRRTAWTTRTATTAHPAVRGVVGEVDAHPSATGLPHGAGQVGARSGDAGLPSRTGYTARAAMRRGSSGVGLAAVVHVPVTVAHARHARDAAGARDTSGSGARSRGANTAAHPAVVHLGLKVVAGAPAIRGARCTGGRAGAHRAHLSCPTGSVAHPTVGVGRARIDAQASTTGLPHGTRRVCTGPRGTDLPHRARSVAHPTVRAGRVRIHAGARTEGGAHRARWCHVGHRVGGHVGCHVGGHVGRRVGDHVHARLLGVVSRRLVGRCVGQG